MVGRNLRRNLRLFPSSPSNNFSTAARRRCWYDWRVHLVTDDTFMAPRETCIANLRGALAGGADVVQLRLKHASTKEFLSWAAVMKPLCRRHGAAFVIDDRLDVALACGADGVHVGRRRPAP